MFTSSTLIRTRKKLGLSQFALSKMARVSRDKITLFECGYREFSDTEIKKIRGALKNAASKDKTRN